MNAFYKTSWIIGVIIFIAASCVPAKRFQELEEQYEKEKMRSELLDAKNENLEVKVTELQSSINRLEEEVDELVSDTLEAYRSLQMAKSRIRSLENQNQNLQQAQEQLLEGNAEETKRLLRQLQATQEDLQGREDKLRELEKNLNEKQEMLANLQQELDSRDERLTELESVLNQKDSLVNALKDKVSNALTGFKNQGLSVHMKNGKVYVSLEEKLLFESGSTVVDPNGKAAIERLAKVLENNPDINIMIEGHTDDVPYIPDEAIKDNWDLSVKRATAVVRILLDNSDIDPARLTASGRSQFVPLAEGESAAARRKNRRTEIILTPDLNELYNIIGNAESQ